MTSIITKRKMHQKHTISHHTLQKRGKNRGVARPEKQLTKHIKSVRRKKK